MTRVEKNCLSASLALHALLLAILLLAPAFSHREPLPPAAPVLEILPADLKLTFDGTVHGGTRPVAPPTQSPPPAPPAAPATKPPDAIKPEPTKPEPANKVAVAPEPVRASPKSQDQEPGRKPEKKTETELAAVDAKSAKSGIKVSTNKVALPAADRKKLEAAERDAKTAAERERARRLAKLFGQSEENLKSALSSTTEITMPGPGGGGPVYADYFAYLTTFYQAQWNRRKPANISVKVALVKARITISRDGTVTASTIVEPSGNSAIDDSVRRVLNENKKLKQLPSDAKESEITVPITFRVEGDTSA